MRFKLSLFLAASAAFIALPVSQSSAQGKAIAPPAPAPDAGIYEGGRGLITTEGPSGMFMNPTSGTLPAHAATLQYCFLLPTNDFSEIMGHGALLAYGVTDFLEIGAIGNYVDFDGGDDPSALGPMVRLRLMQDTAYLPEVSVGYYGKFGDDALDQQAAFAALYKRIPIGDESGFVRSLGIHGGVRNVWDDPQDTFRGYGGLEVQLPLRLYLVGEVSTDDNAVDTPYAYGVQWRLGGINISVANVHTGNPGFDSESFYFGIGSAMQF